MVTCLPYSNSDKSQCIPWSTSGIEDSPVLLRAVDMNSARIKTNDRWESCSTALIAGEDKVRLLRLTLISCRWPSFKPNGSLPCIAINCSTTLINKLFCTNFWSAIPTLLYAERYVGQWLCLFWCSWALVQLIFQPGSMYSTFKTLNGIVVTPSRLSQPICVSPLQRSVIQLVPYSLRFYLWLLNRLGS